MVKVDEYARTRHAHAVENLGVRELARRFPHSRRKIREILGHAEPEPYTRRLCPPSVLDPFKPLIDDILHADKDAPRKQRHTAAKIFRRRDEHGDSRGCRARSPLLAKTSFGEYVGWSSAMASTPRSSHPELQPGRGGGSALGMGEPGGSRRGLGGHAADAACFGRAFSWQRGGNACM